MPCSDFFSAGWLEPSSSDGSGNAIRDTPERAVVAAGRLDVDEVAPEAGRTGAALSAALESDADAAARTRAKTGRTRG